MADINNQNEKEEAKETEGLLTSAQRTEYFDKLDKWLIEAYAWHSFVSALPYIVASSQALNGATSINPAINVALANANVSSSDEQTSDNGTNQRRTNDPATVTAARFPTPGEGGITYKIPPIWKRIAAEFIDSILLFILKLSITFIAVDVFDFMDLERYYMDMIQANLRVDYKMALELTSDILILEFIHRIFACIFEVSWLQHGRNGRVGGATPGKSLMRLKVVQCRNVIPAGHPEEVVMVDPGTDLGLMLALGRSVLKNLVLAFFFPICFAFCFFKFNRTGYDLICNSIVVEETPRNGNNNVNNNNNNNNNFNNNFNNERIPQ